MDLKKLLLATLAGGITLFVLGFLLYGMLLENYFQGQMTSGVMKEEPDMVFLALGNLFAALLLVYIFMKWAAISTFRTGLEAGAIIGLLVSLMWDLTMYAVADMSTLQGALVDALVYTVMFAVAGGVIGWVLGKIK